MPHAFNAVEGLLLAGRAIFVQQAIDELDRLDKLAGNFSGPDFDVAASADSLDELVAWDRLAGGFGGCDGRGHGGWGSGEGADTERAQPAHLEVWHTVCAIRTALRQNGGRAA